MAEKCDCSASYIEQIENTRSKSGVEALVSIANVLGVTLDQLLKTDYVHPESIYLQEIAQRIATYSHKKKIEACEVLMSYLDSLEKFSKLK